MLHLQEILRYNISLFINKLSEHHFSTFLYGSITLIIQSLAFIIFFPKFVKRAHKNLSLSISLTQNAEAT